MEQDSQEYSVVRVDDILGQVNLEEDYYIQNLKVYDENGRECTVQSGDNFQPI